MNYNDYWKTWNDPHEPFGEWKIMTMIYPRLLWIDTYAQKLNKKTILDVGCGQGHIAIPLAKRGYTVTGIDISDYILKTAEKKAKDLKVDVAFLCEDVFTHAKTYDIVIATHIIEHMDKPNKLAEKLTTLVAKGGLLFLTFPTYLGDELDHKHAFNVNAIRDLFPSQYVNMLFDDIHKGIVWASILI